MYVILQEKHVSNKIYVVTIEISCALSRKLRT